MISVLVTYLLVLLVEHGYYQDKNWGNAGFAHACGESQMNT